MHDVAWAGSPAVPEQLLAGAQAALVHKTMPNWTCPPAPPIIDLIVRVQRLVKFAEDTLAEAHDALEDMQKNVDDLHTEKASIQRTARGFKAGSWAYICKASLQADLDDLIEDVDSTLDRALRSERSRRGSRSVEASTPRRIVIEKDKKDDDAPISVERQCTIARVFASERIERDND